MSVWQCLCFACSSVAVRGSARVLMALILRIMFPFFPFSSTPPTLSKVASAEYPSQSTLRGAVGYSPHKHLAAVGGEDYGHVKEHKMTG